jgi:hypothetical protein
MFYLQMYEVLPRPRSASRDSGYTTPSPLVENVSIRSDQKVSNLILLFILFFMHMCMHAVVTKMAS